MNGYTPTSNDHALAILGLALALSVPAGAQPSLQIHPASPAPGGVVQLSLTDSIADNTIQSITARMAGEPLHFVEAAPGHWRAIGGIPVDATDSVRAQVVVQRVSGAADTIHAAAMLPRPVATAPARQLAVSSRFTQPLDAATQARIARENATAREIGKRAHGTPPMWSDPFTHPRDARITSQFGTGRMFNGRVASRHLGVDFSGGTGTPVHAANRGVVALVDTFFLAGNVIYVDHGGGIVTGYFHLSEALVKQGDIVERGQRIGSVGETGRVTGPHLHWSARYGAITVNPLDLVALGRWFGSGSVSAP
jgi:murein DD-endopeptidase MepM/ murein hydrolase activator NlpD